MLSPEVNVFKSDNVAAVSDLSNGHNARMRGYAASQRTWLVCSFPPNPANTG